MFPADQPSFGKDRSLIRDLMAQFAERTGLSPAGKSPRRYLWTDAFAVCNFLELFNQTGEDGYKQLALLLVDQVHHILGRHRPDDSRTGWISGLSEQEGEKHPTKGGLRIGKSMNERGPADLPNEDLEWDRDGQYYHYLTKWMHALNRVSRVSGNFIYNRWAVELAQTAHARFTFVPAFGRQNRMVWKMSIDLSHPLVSSMGHHDPLDGYITYHQLQATANQDPERLARRDLQAEIHEMAQICYGKNWATDDPLGIGGLLFDAGRVTQLMDNSNLQQTSLLDTLLDSALTSLELFSRQNSLNLQVDYRLGFRELGLSIGLRAINKISGIIKKRPAPYRKIPLLKSRIEDLMPYTALIEEIKEFWLDPENQQLSNWTGHRDINEVMLATSLSPDGYLDL
jgi:hypothetical protein